MGPGPDLGLGKLDNCPGALHMSRHLLFVWYSRVGWASTAPLLKASQRPPHVLSPLICFGILG